ncbi:MAG: GtrA family protein, partial [Rhizobiaceae bacterium]
MTAAAGALVAMAMQSSQWLRDGDLFGDDNDSMLRLVEVRDLLGGQGWYDLVQHRMGPAGGFEMHWSRLVDAPVAALILIGRALGLPPELAETAAAVLFPLLLAIPALYAIIRTAVA